ncbi:MAG: hypothetical protein HKM24_04635 [Gammaproteobacteria bacterium]|nr:hypothetical protein [Gammaproteobacteria bacterium]
MHSLTAIKMSLRRWVKPILSAMGVAWLSILLQPCAMAFGGQADDSCPHCPPMEQMDCAGMQADQCDFTSPINIDGRSSQLQLDDSPTFFVIPSPIDSIVSSRLTQQFFCPNHSPPIDYGPPLNVRYCVYLK